MSKNKFFISTCITILLTVAGMTSCNEIAYETPKKTEFSITPSANRNSSLVFSGNGQTFTLDGNSMAPAFTIVCNYPWVARSYQDWLKVERSETGFTLTVTENTSIYERKASLFVMGGEVYDTWTVTQLPK